MFSKREILLSVKIKFLGTNAFALYRQCKINKCNIFFKKFNWQNFEPATEFYIVKTKPDDRL